MKTHHTKLRGHVAILAVVLCSAFFVTACEKTPVSTARTDNPEVPVALLFENDGVKVYRFYDRGYAIYYTDARGATAWQQYHGKTSSPVRVETSR